MSESALSVRGVDIRYSVEGCGPDVLFVHGWAASRRMWAYYTGRLAGRYRCWAIDLPGCGESDKPDAGWYSIPNFTAILNEFAQAQGMARLRLVAHSMGGMIALHWAASHPESVERLVVINPVVTGRARLRPLAHRRYTPPLLNWTLALSPRVLQPLLSHLVGNRVEQFMHIRRRTEDFTKGTAESLLCSGRAVVTYDVSPLLDQIQAPTLMIVGTRDLQVSPAEGRLAASRIPHARLALMRAGHLATDDRPREVLDELQGFLD